MNKPKLFSYIRFSSGKQSDGQSVERQTETAQRIANQYGLELDTLSFKDLGVSAFKGRNATQGSLREFINQIGKRVPVGSWLVVENLDRLSRDGVLTALDLLKEILQKGITVVTGMDSKVYTYESLSSSMMDLILSVMLFSRAHEESVTKKTRVESQARSLIQKNLVRESGTPALVIESIGQNVWWSSQENGLVIPHPVYFAVAKKIIDMKWDGCSPGEIQRYLNEHYQPPTKDKTGNLNKWGMNLIRNFLNPTVHGRKEFILDKRDSSGQLQKQKCVDEEGNEYFEIEKETFVIEDYYPALMTESDYLTLASLDKVRAATRNPAKGDSLQEIGLLSGIGILRCGKCGLPMTKNSAQKARFRYVCSSKNTEGKSCGNSGFTGQPLEHVVLQLIADHVWNNNQEDKTEWFTHEISKLDKMIKKLVRLGALTDESEIDDLAQEINTYRAQKRELEFKFNEYKIEKSSQVTTGWDEFRKFDTEDVTNPERKRIRLKIKQAIKSIDCTTFRGRYGLFMIRYMDNTEQRIVLKYNRRSSPGEAFVDIHTVNNRVLVELSGITLHTHIEALIDPSGYKELRKQWIEDNTQQSNHPPTIIDDLTE